MASKFSSLLQAKQTQSPTVEENVAESPTPVVEELKAAEPSAQAIEETKTPEVTSFAPEAKVEAPAVVAVEPKAPLQQAEKTISMQPQRGKKGHPDYNQVTIYLKKDTQNQAKIALLQARDQRDFSELVEDLLTSWLTAQK